MQPFLRVIVITPFPPLLPSVACPPPPPCPYHEAYFQTRTKATPFFFRVRLARPQDGCHSCCPFRRTRRPHFIRACLILLQVLNKVAGVYGLIAMLTGAAGNAAQLTLYIYSVLALAALAWGIRTINDVRYHTSRCYPVPAHFCSQENPKHMLYFAHAFFADHILNTTWTVYFAVHWWLYTPHDGRRNANSPAQQALIDGYIGQHQNMSEDERAAAAERVWRSEKSQALTIIILGWLIKVRPETPYDPLLPAYVFVIRSSILPPSYTPSRTISVGAATVRFPSHVPAQKARATHPSRMSSQRSPPSTTTTASKRRSI